jgi:hypothetical protein
LIQKTIRHLACILRPRTLLGDNQTQFRQTHFAPPDCPRSLKRNTGFPVNR